MFFLVAVMEWRSVLLVILCLISARLVSPRHQRTALYPSAYRIKRGTHSLVNPMFQSSMAEVNLLFEVLLAGLQIKGGGGGGGERSVRIPDEELASLRGVRKLEVVCQDVLPKGLSEIRRLTAALAQRRSALSGRDFERTVLTMVYTVQVLADVSAAHQREVWADALLRLFRAVRKDLT